VNETAITKIRVSIEAILPNGVTYWTECSSLDDHAPVSDPEKSIKSMGERCLYQLDRVAKKAVKDAEVKPAP
jgi:hypothetical protein